MDKPTIFLGYVHPGHVSHVFFLSVMHLLSVPDYAISVAGKSSGPLIARPRNELAQYFLETDNEYFLSVDTDIQFTPDAFASLISRNLPIVSGVYMGLSEGAREWPVALLEREGVYERASWKTLGGRKPHGVVQVGGVGMGFCLVRRDVFEALGTGVLYPFAESISDKGQPLGEDTTFCARAQGAGFESYIDTDARVKHLKEHLI